MLWVGHPQQFYGRGQCMPTVGMLRALALNGQAADMPAAAVLCTQHIPKHMLLL